MQVNGKPVDTIQWLRETGGANADKKFSSTQSTVKPDTAKKTTLDKDESALLRSQVQLNKASVAPGMTPDKVSTYISQLKALQPPAQTALASSTNNVSFTSPKTNTSAVTGSNNYIDFRSNTAGADNNSITVTGNENVARGYNGGQKNNTMTITGDSNRMYAGQGVSNTSITVKGGHNNVSLADNASANKVSIAGNNVKVSLGSAGLAAGSNQNWNISVAANNVEVNVVNGQATVAMANEDKSKYNVTVDNVKKTVSVTAL